MTAGRLGVWMAAGFAVLASSAALAEGDPEAGAKVFNKCKACHVATEEKNRVGPHLVGIVGRPAASVEGYKYSTAMAESGIVWDEEILDKYLASPKDVVPGGRMAFVGLREEEDRADVIAYLKSAPQ
ncbi:MAG TPA: cytochrome c family protein [Geminicoccaceae bacterium]|nr:cytochrome c family protein [Geminicoccaceae bacterium]